MHNNVTQAEATQPQLKKRVVVAVPVYKEEITDDEKVSMRHLKHYLSSYDIILFAPEGLNVSAYGDFPVKRFDAQYFQGTHTYSQLLVSRHFYEVFSDYDFMLIYQTDCLVFSDDLQHWCDLGYDYIGAPWVSDGVMTDVGNGGLSLRNVHTFLRVLAIRDRWDQRALRLLEFAIAYIRKFLRYTIVGLRSFLQGKRNNVLKQGVQVARKTVRETRPSYKNEDYFWSFDAPKLFPRFSIPSTEVAVGFSFEQDPRLCYEKNGGILPFGCHNWTYYDRAFWEAHILNS